MQDNEKSYEESIASDIFNMIDTTRQRGMDMSTGFYNEPLATPKMAIRYLFYTKEYLLRIPMIPKKLKQRFGVANVLGMVEKGGKPVGIHLLCALDKQFQFVQEDDILRCLYSKGVEGWANQMRTALQDDFAEHEQSYADKPSGKPQ